MKTINNVVDLRNALLENFDQMKSGELDVKTGKELTNALGKVMNSVKIELSQNIFLERKNKIGFLENDENIKYTPE
jgi:hypothetical protein